MQGAAWRKRSQRRILCGLAVQSLLKFSTPDRSPRVLQEVEMVNASSKYKVFSVVNGSGGLAGGFGGDDPRLFTPCGLAADDEAWVTL